MKFFLPDWEDRVDPGFNFEKDEYSKEHDRGIIWNDKTININWPLELVDNIILSDKDKNLPALDAADNNFVYGG